ncbi:MAG: PAS domain-containing protein [gamma proteobacterium symbiont of Bathyaustriella thionipta]|nr:PAS domain-containing protein [gamma proteobacterium symbiont of Bathyaustriella thionipta]
MQIERNAADIENIVGRVEQVVRVSAAYMKDNPSLTEAAVYAQLRANLKANSLIFGSAAAFAPYSFDKQQRLFAPYIYRAGDGLKQMDIGKEGYDYTQPKWSWWSSAQSSAKASWSDPYFDQDAGESLMVTFSEPFANAAAMRGVITADISLPSLRQLLQQKVTAGIPTILLSQSGHYLFHADAALVVSGNIFTQSRQRQQSWKETLGHLVLSGKAGSYASGEGDDDRVWFYAPVKINGWGIAQGVPKKMLEAGLQQQLKRYARMFIGVLLLVGIFIWLMLGRILRPLNQLDEAARSIAREQPIVLPEISTHDELGRLGDAFNSMMRTLLKRERALRDARDDFEQRVNERTEELDKINHQLRYEVEDGEQARRKLQSSEQHFRTLVENLPGGVIRCLWEDGWVVRYASGQIEQLVGLSIRKLIGQPYSHLLDQVHPLDRERVQEALQQVNAQQSQLNIEYRVLNPKSGIIWIRDISRVVYDEQNKPRLLDSLLFDVTDRKQASAALRHSQERFQSLEKGLEKEYFFFSRDKKGKMTHISASVEVITGYSKQEIGDDFDFLLADAAAKERLHERMQHVLNGEQPNPTVVNARCKSGEIKQLEVMSVAVRSETGQIEAIEGIVKVIP